MTKLPELPQSEVPKTIEESADAAAFTKKLPSWSDLKHAFKAEPEPGPDGTLSLDVPMDTRTTAGQRRANAYIELMTPAWVRQAQHAMEMRGKEHRKPMRDAQGRDRNVLDEHEDLVGRRFGTSRTSMLNPGVPDPEPVRGRHKYIWSEKQQRLIEITP